MVFVSDTRVGSNSHHEIEGIGTKSPPGSSGAMKRTLGTGAIVFMVVAAAAPLTAATGVLPLSIVFSENSAAPFYYVIAMAILCLFVVGYNELSKHIRNVGGFYSYIERGLGRVPGNASAMLALGAYALTVVALTVYAGPFITQLVGTFTGWQDSPWWLWSLVFWALIALLGYRDIDLSSKVLGVLLVLEAVALLVLDIAILSQGGAEGVTAAPVNPVEAMTHGSPASGIMWAALCFVGFEATAVFRSEAKNPEKTVPRATYLAVFSVGILYLFTSFSIVIGAGSGNVVGFLSADPSAGVFVLGSEFISPVYSNIVNVLLVGSVFACALSFHNVVSRYKMAMGQSGLLPAYFGKVHVRHGVPSNASAVLSGLVLVGVIVSAVLNLDPVTGVFAPLVGVLGFAVLALMALTSLAVIFYFNFRPTLKVSIFVRIIAPVLAILGLVFVLILSFTNIDVITGSTGASIFAITLMVVLPLTGALLSLRKTNSAGIQDH